MWKKLSGRWNIISDITYENSDKITTWTVQAILQFIVKWDFTESVPKISLIIQYFLTICVSVASFERSVSKLKLIKTTSDQQQQKARLVDSSILFIERDLVEKIEFDVVIEKFSKINARKIPFK